MEAIVFDPWIHSQSFIDTKINEDGKLTAYGVLMHHGAEFRFAVTQQSTGGAAIRGSVSAISPADGHVLQVAGKEKAEILARLEKERPEYLEKMAGKRIRELNITASISLNSLDIKEIKDAVARSALKLYSEHASRIHRVQGEIARPETITPSVAAHKSVDEYMKKAHPYLSEKKFTAYRSSIRKMCAELPHIAMAEYKQSIIRNYFKEKKASKSNQELLRKFWAYCLDAKVCKGSLPFPPIHKRPVDADKATFRAIRPDTLSLEEQDALYNLIMDDLNGPDCGCALQLWGGYSARVACTFVWGDVIWGEDHDDYVRVKYFLPDLTGATHDYTAPLFPAGALVLRKRYNTLSERYTKEALAKMPIVSTVRDPAKGIKADVLVQHATMRLHSSGVTYAMLSSLRKERPDVAASRLLLLNTYAYNVNRLCALESEPGTAKFLQHESISGNVTDDHYTTFSDDEAGKRLHTIMSSLIPMEFIEAQDSPILLPDGKEKHTFTPEFTRHRVGLVGEYILGPGQEIALLCPHGATGSASVRAIEADGSKRRKARSKKSDA